MKLIIKRKKGGNKTAENLPSSSEDKPRKVENGTYLPSRSVGRKRSISSATVTPAVQCHRCGQWRIVPGMEKYEEIREHCLEQPFLCGGQGKEWKPDMSCEDPPDIEQDGSRIWVTDRPNIPRPPPGWDRRLSFRDEWSSRCADVNYYAPWGEKFRSKAAIGRYLDQNPQHKEAINLAKFSFKIPKPLQQQDTARNPSSLEIQQSAEAMEDIESEEPNGSGGSSSDDNDPTWSESASSLPPKKRY